MQPLTEKWVQRRSRRSSSRNEAFVHKKRYLTSWLYFLCVAKQAFPGGVKCLSQLGPYQGHGMLL